MGRFFSPPRAYLSGEFARGLQIMRHRIACEPLAGMRMVFFSDIHASRRVSDARLARFFEKINALEPELILLGGDFAEDRASLVRLLRAMEALRAPLGVYACLGNNDAQIDDFFDLVRGRVRLLVNQRVDVRRGGGTLALAGVDEIDRGRSDARGLFVAPADLRILLAHYPLPQDYGQTPAADLQLSGHTHGGQFNFLGITPYTILFESSRHSWISGECCLDGVRTLVSNGVGMSRIPLRVGAPPQAHLLTVQP